MTEDIGNSEKLLKRIDNRDRLLKTVTIAALLVLMSASFINQIRLNDNQQALQKVINDNQQSTLQARQSNVSRQDEIKADIKCIFLARFDNPAAASPSATRAQVESALDKCAKTTQ